MTFKALLATKTGEAISTRVVEMNSVPGFRAWRAFSVPKGICRSGSPIPRR
jgi:hypothetical protein